MDSDVERLADVSRETLQDLETYAALAAKWNKTINLVAKNSVSALWKRHILDSLQLWPHLPKVEHVVDFGSGGGFPALVVAICAKRSEKISSVTLIESDARKSAFLRTVIRELSLPAQVNTARIEELASVHADIATARALAPCRDLLKFCDLHLKPGGRAFFLKGANASDEVSEAERDWRFDLVRHPSKTSEDGVILEFGNLRDA